MASAAPRMQRPVRSLLHPRRSVDTPETEPLPLYTPRREDLDPETASIVSEAPTYRSEVPSYSASVNAPLISSLEHRPVGLPSLPFAPGWGYRPHGPVGDLRNHDYAVANWSIARSKPTTRHYENVARRRMQRESSVSDIIQTLSVLPAAAIETPAATTTIASSSSASPMAPASGAAAAAAPLTPYSPAEDPDLVGEAAASRARSQRLYREGCLFDPREALRGESKSWDFMAVQMKDWDGRQPSWNNFRKDMDTGRRGKLAKRIGLRRRGS
jgi:hypothetical protein